MYGQYVRYCVLALTLYNLTFLLYLHSVQKCKQTSVVSVKISDHLDLGLYSTSTLNRWPIGGAPSIVYISMVVTEILSPWKSTEFTCNRLAWRVWDQLWLHCSVLSVVEDVCVYNVADRGQSWYRSQRAGSNDPSVKSPVVDEERTRSGGIGLGRWFVFTRVLWRCCLAVRNDIRPVINLRHFEPVQSIVRGKSENLKQ